MGKLRLDARALGLAAALVLVAALFVRRSRRAWSDHDVSDPGVTL